MKQTKIIAFFENLTMLLMLAVSVMAQPCADTIYMDDITFVNKRIIRYPVILSNPCPIGGFNMIITTSDPELIRPIGGDTIPTILNGDTTPTRSRLSYHLEIDTIIQMHVDTTYPYPEFPDSMLIDTTYPMVVDTITHLPWEYFVAQPGVAYPNSLFAVGINRIDSIPPHPIALDSGRGPLFFAKFFVNCNLMANQVIDTSVEVRIEQAVISDSSGFTNPVVYYNGQIRLHYDPAISPPSRGDCNCNGEVRGSDVTYLVAYFKGAGPFVCPCMLKAGDANGDGLLRGGDVTYLVRYFKLIGPPPPPY
jgi:hypothetical protein